VVRPVPFHCAVELLINPDPVITIVVFGAPATTEDGVIEVIAGVGFDAGGGFGGFEFPPQPDTRQPRTTAWTHAGRFMGRANYIIIFEDT
jgi:hypothetical protein